ncbi:MAG: hypothetical protein K9H64_03375 [Bacteroidales bacterium]|nr:hypothetical protein [Bacteroidales bacterium]MCF8456454.1 hypothetical protein [Bacteroidales bacterium]
MKKILENIQDFLSVENLIKHRKLLVYFIFVAIASIFWLLSALSKNYETQIKYPVRFVNLPKDKVLINELPEFLNLNVDGYGFTLLRYKVKRSIVPVSIDMGKNNLFEVPDKANKYFIPSRYLIKQVSSRISDDLKVLEIQPDSIIFDFTQMVSKTVALKPDISYTTDRQFLVKRKPWCEPDSLILSGPKSILDKVDFCMTKHLDIENLSNSIQRSIGVKAIDGIKLSEKRVNVFIDVEKFTEATMRVPIEIINLPDSLQLKVFPDGINISYKVALSDFDKVKPYQFKAVINYKGFPSGSNSDFHKMRVELKKFPSFVRSISYNPKQVDYLFEKK